MESVISDSDAISAVFSRITVLRCWRVAGEGESDQVNQQEGEIEDSGVFICREQEALDAVE